MQGPQAWEGVFNQCCMSIQSTGKQYYQFMKYWWNAFVQHVNNLLSCEPFYSAHNNCLCEGCPQPCWNCALGRAVLSSTAIPQAKQARGYFYASFYVMSIGRHITWMIFHICRPELSKILKGEKPWELYHLRQYVTAKLSQHMVVVDHICDPDCVFMLSVLIDIKSPLAFITLMMIFNLAISDLFALPLHLCQLSMATHLFWICK